MFKRVISVKDEMLDLVQKGNIDVFIRLANCTQNWTSQSDKTIAKLFPKFEEIDESNAQLGTYNSANIRIKHLYLIGDKVVTLVNAYVYDKKNAKGQYEIDEDAFLTILKELDQKHKGRILGIDFKNDTSYSKQKIINKLQNIVKFSKVYIHE